MSKTVTWRLRKLLVAILLCVTFFAFATACGGSVTGNEDPGQENASVLIVGGAPGEELGKEGDICFDSATRTLYVKNAQHWVETEYLSCEVEENALSVTFKDGTVKRYALASGEENACTEHSSSGEIYEVYPATCIHPGIGVQVCDKCGSAFAVIIPANGNHKVQSDGTCSVCGEKVAFMAEPENPEDPKSPVVVQGVEGSKETKIVIPEKIGGQDVKIASEAFKDNTTIKEVEIQGSVSVGANAFEGCTNLEILTIQEGTESIGEEAFKGCTELDEVTIPETVTSVGANAFEGTGYYEKQDNWTIEEEHKVLYNNGVLLKAVNYTEPTPAGRRNAARSGGGEYQLKENVRVIADGAFVGVENLTRVVLNEKLKTVGANAFGGSELESVTLSAGIDHYEGLKELGESVKFFFRGADGWAYDGVLGTHYFRSDNAPTQEGNYWYEENGAPVVWELTEIQLSGEYKKAFNLNEEFSSEGLKVTAIFNGATVEVETGFDVDSTAVNLLKAGSYDVTVSYLGVSATYSVTVKPFTVTIVYGNGTANGTATVENGGEKNYTLPAAPTAAEGYEFAGWLVDGEVVAREEKTELTVTADVTVTAQWTKLYLVSLGAHENATVSGLVTGYHAKGDTLTFTVTVNAGYKLVSVKNGETELTAQDGTYSVTVGTENITITVTTEKVKVNTSVVDADGVTLEVAQEGGTATITVNGTPKKVGYNFDKWTVTVGDAPTDYAEPLTIDLGNEDVTVTFTAHWTAKTPNVSFNLNGGTHSTEKYEVSELSQDNKYTITITGEPTYEKHRFEKWTATLNDGNVDVMENQIVIGLADDMTVVITANWVEQFTVTYKLGDHAASDAAVPTPDTVDINGTVILPEAPNAAEGYEFAGWKVGSDETLKQPKDDITVTADVTVTAQWTKLYLVSLGAHDNATVKDLATGYHAKDDTLTFTVEVEKGYKLVSVMNGTEKLEEQDGSYTVTVGTENITITVTTEAVKVNTSVVDAEGVTLKVAQEGATATITVEGEPTKAGYNFKEWTVTVDGASTDYNAELTIDLGNDDVTVVYTATWTAKTPNVTVQGEGTGEVTTSYQFNEEAKTYTVTINGTPTYEKHRFDGWTVAGGTPTKLTAEQTTFTVKLSDDMTVVITAKWVEQFTVTYALGEHAAADAAAPAAKTVDKDGTVTLPEAPAAAEGYEFAGWLVSGEEVAREEKTELKVTADVTVTARWTAIYTLTVIGAENADVSYVGQQDVYHTGDTVMVTIEAHDGFKVKQIAVSGDDEAQRETGDTECMVTFANSNITITVTIVNVYKVEVQGDHIENPLFGPEGPYEANTSVKVLIEASEGYEIVSVMNADVELHADGDGFYTVEVVDKDVTITVTTKGKETPKYSVTVNGDHIDTIEYEPEGNSYDAETSVTITITPTDGYKITSIEADVSDETYEEIIEEDGSYAMISFQITSNVTITVTTEEIKYTVSLKAETEHVEIGDFKVGDVTNNGPYKNGTTVTFTLTVNDPLYVITSVKNDTQDLTAQGGRFSVTINGANVEITVTTDYNYGTEENPLTIEQAIALAEAQNVTDKIATSEQVFAKGIIVGTPTKEAGKTYFSGVTLKDESKDGTTILIKTLNLTDAVTEIDENDIITVQGYIKKYDGVIQFCTESNQYVNTIANERGLSGIEVTNNDGATVKTSDGGDLPGSAENGTEITFKVTVSEEGKKAVVTVNGVTIQADGDGNYKFTVHGDMEVVITVVDASAATEPESYDLTISTLGVGKSYGDKSSIDINDISFKWVELGDFGDGIQMRTKNGKSSSIENIDPFNQTISKVIFEWNSRQSSKNGVLTVELSDSSSFTGAAEESIDKNSDKTTTELVVKGNYTYIKIVHGNNGAVYLDKITIICGTEAGGGDTSEADLKTAQDALDGLTIESEVNEDKTITLPADNEAGVTYEWKLEDGAGVATLTSNSLKITRKATAATVKLSATATYNGQTTSAKSFEIKVSANSTGGETTQTVWKKVTDVSKLQAGDQIILVYSNKTMGSLSSGKYAAITGVTGSGDTVTIPSNTTILTLEEADNGGWIFKVGDNTLSLTSTSSNGKIVVQASVPSSNKYIWTISISSGKANIEIKDDTGASRFFRYYNNAFANYKINTQNAEDPVIYRLEKASSDTGMEGPSVNTVANMVATLPHKEN